jgi:hypothetical protein
MSKSESCLLSISDLFRILTFGFRICIPRPSRANLHVCFPRRFPLFWHDSFLARRAAINPLIREAILLISVDLATIFFLELGKVFSANTSLATSLENRRAARTHQAA